NADLHAAIARRHGRPVSCLSAARGTSKDLFASYRRAFPQAGIVAAAARNNRQDCLRTVHKDRVARLVPPPHVTPLPLELPTSAARLKIEPVYPLINDLPRAAREACRTQAPGRPPHGEPWQT